MSPELWVILALCATVPFAAWLGRVTAPEAREVVRTVERVIEKRPKSRVEVWEDAYRRASQRWDWKNLNPAANEQLEQTWRATAAAAVKAWDADAESGAPGTPPRYPAACAHCGSPIEPLKEG